MLNTTTSRAAKYTVAVLATGVLSVGLAGLVSQPASALRLGDTIEAVAKPIEGPLSPNNWRPSHPDRPTPPSRPSRDSSPQSGGSRNHNHRGDRARSQPQVQRTAPSGNTSSNPQPTVVARSTPQPTSTASSEPVVSVSSESSASESSDTKAVVSSRPLSMATMPKTPVKVVSPGSDHYEWDVLGIAWQWWFVASIIGGVVVLHVARLAETKGIKEFVGFNSGMTNNN